MEKLASQTAVRRQWTRAFADECMAVAARSIRRDGIAAWRWRYPGSPCAPAMA
jgi:hypothetical protein